MAKITAADNYRLLKLEHDMRNEAWKAERDRAITEYNIMMGTLEDPSEGEEDESDE